jgi:hypothetical protein
VPDMKEGRLHKGVGVIIFKESSFFPYFINFLFIFLSLILALSFFFFLLF